MKRLIIILALLSVSAFALSPCPTGVPSGVTNCYYSNAVTGLDTNSGMGYTITNLALSANVVTVTVAHQFTVGQQVDIIQPSNAGFSFLSNQTLTVATSSSTQFTASFTHANQGSAASGGVVTDPWQFAVKMGNCASNCSNKYGGLSGYTRPSAGDGFIIRGGDSWHFGDTLASSYVGFIASGNGSGCDTANCGWTLGNRTAWTGTTSNPIYIGNNASIGWYNPSICGASYCRPIMQGDNPHSLTATNCTYDEDHFAFVGFWAQTANTYLDDIEFDGYCFAQFSGVASYINDSAGTIVSTNRYFQDLYFHGATHASYSTCVQTNAVNSGGTCSHAEAIEGTAGQFAYGNDFNRIVVDFSDSSPDTMSGWAFGGYSIHHSYIKSTVTGIIVNNSKTIHDNVFDSINGKSDAFGHGNVLRQNPGPGPGDQAVYNNVLKNSFPGGVGCGNPVMWLTPNTGATDYAFNNIIYGTNCSSSANYWDVCVKAGNSACTKTTATITQFNNTIITPTPIPAQFNASTPSTIVNNWFNNHCIIGSLSAPGVVSDCIGTGGGATFNVGTGNVVWDTGTATTQGYTAAETYPYSPLTALKGTVGTGQDMSSTITTMLASADPYIHAAGEAAANSTGFGIIYDSVNHRITASPATALTTVLRGSPQDTGAYEFSTTVPPLTLTGACSGAGSGTLATTQGGHTLSVTCTAGVASGTTTEAHGVGDNITLAAAATSGALVSLTGGGCVGSPCSINSLQGNITVTAQFALFPTTTLTCSTSCNVQYGTTVTLASTIANLTGITTDTWTLYDPLLTPVVTCTGVSCNGTFNGGSTPSLTFTPLLSGPYTITAQSNAVSSNTSTVNINVGFSMGGRPAGAVGH